MFELKEESILKSTDRRSPFYLNLPHHESKPIDDLVSFFKYWKLFIRALIVYLREMVLMKEFEANLNQQMVGIVQFPGFRDLPNKLIKDLEVSGSPPASQAGTPSKELKKNLSSNSLNTMASSNGSGEKRANLFKTKSNNTFLKNRETGHKRNVSLGSVNAKPSPVSSPKTHLSHGNDVKIPPNFFPHDSLFSNLAPMLINHHSQIYLAQARLTKEINTKIIGKLESLLKNLSIKIKEIKSTLKNDSFANADVVKEVSKTGQILTDFMEGVKLYSGPKPVNRKQVEQDEGEEEGVIDDPFLIKLKVDYQIKRQLVKENYTFAAYVNLQNISKNLFTYMAKDLLATCNKLGQLLTHEAVYLSNGDKLVNFQLNLKQNISNSLDHDWEHFISHNPHFVNTYEDSQENPKRETRRYSFLQIPYSDSIHSKCIRFGTIYKKSKILKNYNRYYYVLSCNYLHEFKIENETITQSQRKKEKDKIGGFIGHDDTPVKSYNLNDYSIKMKDEKSFKFILTKNSNSARKFTFKCLNGEDFDNWFNDLHEMLKFGDDHIARFTMVQEKLDNRENTDARSNELQNVKSNSTSASSDKVSPPSSLGLTKPKALTVDDTLSAIFTPRVKSPREQGEENVFDSMFMNGITSNLSTPNSSPNDQPIISPESSSHQQEHENYLKLQREILKQQQELMKMKLQANERENQKPQSLQQESPVIQAVSDSGLASKTSSSESINSLLHNPESNIKKILTDNEHLISNVPQKKIALFTLNDDSSDDFVRSPVVLSGLNSASKDASSSSTDIPKVFVSSNH